MGLHLKTRSILRQAARVAVSLLLGALAFCPGPAFAAGAGHPPVSVIFDTDMAGDCDDCGALAVLNKFADSGEARILACVVNSRTREKAVAASVSAINTYYGRPGIPIGVYHGGSGTEISSTYTAKLRDQFPNQALPDDQEPAALPVYRSALASAPDKRVTIISVGFLVNLEDLLKSKPDLVSPLSGVDLVRAKVRKLVVMGGAYPRSDPARGEYNFALAAGSTRYVIANWPGPILFSGFEIGAKIITGKSLASVPEGDPVRRAYELSYGNCVRNGRPSWDLTAVLAAVRDPGFYWDISRPGRCVVQANGTNRWVPGGDQTYLIRKMPPEEIGAILNRLLACPPGAAACP
jgi:inosine-uridine nucleoside N-ribohydrolase